MDNEEQKEESIPEVESTEAEIAEPVVEPAPEVEPLAEAEAEA